MYQCDHCKAEFNRIESLETHLKVVHQFRPVKCHLCNGKEYPDIIGHHRNYHEGNLFCPFCKHESKSRDCQTTHIKGQHRDKVGLHECAGTRHEEDGPTDMVKKLASLGVNCKDEVLKKQGYLLSYDKENLQTRFTFEVLTPATLKQTERPERQDYKEDEELPDLQATPESIHFLGLECGHLAAAANHYESEQAFIESYLMGNIVPTPRAINCGMWGALEQFVRELTAKWAKVCVFSGPVYDKSEPKKMSAGGIQIAIPTHLFKIIYMEREGEEPLMQCYLIPNKKVYNSYFHHKSTLEIIESMTGIKFLTQVKPAYTWSNIQLKRHKCTFCNKTFCTSSQLEQHNLIHKNQCRKCKKTFPSKEELKKHSKSHASAKCEICKKTFQDVSQLRMHSLTHTRIKPFQCDECDDKFAQKSHLATHKLTVHSNEKPYKCGKCELAFKQKSALDKHLLTHTKNMPFVCPQCGKSCRRKDQLKEHIRRMHEDKTKEVKQDHQSKAQPKGRGKGKPNIANWSDEEDFK